MAKVILKQSQNRPMILLLLSLAIFMVILDSAIINVALPAMKAALHFDTSSLQWVLTAYILTFGGFLMLGGRTADLFGRRRLLVLGIGGFSLFSLLLGLTTSSVLLIALRALQGLAAAFMAPTALSILLTTFEEGEERNRALSVWSMVAAGGGAVGVFLGGVLTQYLGWQWCFFVNVPAGIITILGILRYIPAQREDISEKHLDLPGAVMVTGGLVVLVYALTLISQAGWNAKSTLIAFGVSIVLLAAFLFNEARVKYPLVPLTIFRSRNVSGGNLIMLPVVAGALGMFFFISLYIQNVLHYSPSLSGLSFLPLPIIIGFISIQAPRLLNRFGFKPLLITGTSLMIIGTFLLSFLTPTSSYVTNLLPAFLILALGMGLAFVAVTVAATSGIPDHETGLASGLINTSQQLGGALGLAILTVVASTTTTADLASGKVLAQASMHGYQMAFLCSTVLMVMALLVSIFVIRTPKDRSQAANISYSEQAVGTLDAREDKDLQTETPSRA
ncbi:MAG TPA: MFS transporter [Ktedonobacteraceae bacterium]